MNISNENLERYGESSMRDFTFDLYKQNIEMSFCQIYSKEGEFLFRDAVIKCKGVSSFSYIYGYSDLSGGMLNEIAAVKVKKLENMYSLVISTQYTGVEGIMQIKCLDLEEIK